MLDVLDTAGTEDLYVLRDQYMRENEGFLLVYEVTSRSSFEDIRIYRAQILRAKGTLFCPA